MKGEAPVQDQEREDRERGCIALLIHAGVLGAVGTSQKGRAP